MKSIRKHSRFLGIIAVTLVCSSFAAAPASAAMSADFDLGGNSELSLRDQISEAFGAFQDRVTAFLLDLGSIFANQDGAGILD